MTDAVRSDGHRVFGTVLTDTAELDAVYHAPTKAVARKKLDHLDPGCRAFIASSPLLLIATADRAGQPTVSPKGGAPGFVLVVDDHHLAIPDYPGNNLIGGLRNIVANPAAGVIFMIPGCSATLRVDGKAVVSSDPNLVGQFGRDNHPACTTAVGIEVASAFLHCASSFNRANLWNPETWNTIEQPDIRSIGIDHLRLTLPHDELPPWAQRGHNGDTQPS